MLKVNKLHKQNPDKQKEQILLLSFSLNLG